MTQKIPHAELIAKIEGAVANTKGLATWTFTPEKCQSLLEDVLTALEFQPFDVLQWLRGDGICKHANMKLRAINNIIEYNYNDEDDNWYPIKPSDLLLYDWQPYTPEPVHGSREWAEAQNETGSVQHESDTGCWCGLIPEDPMFDNGWSIFEKPKRVPGRFYYAYDAHGESQPVEAIKDGEFLVFGSNCFMNERDFIHVDSEAIDTPKIDWSEKEQPVIDGGGL